ncbi:MAG: extracellular solute-binding protein [Lentisphaerota bacterium]
MGSICFAGDDAIIRVEGYYDPNNPEWPSTRRLLELMREHPEIKVGQWGGISLPSSGNRAALMMSIAGKSAPDVGSSAGHSIQREIAQGFLCPLNEWIGDDLDGNGQIDDNETRWAPWRKIPKLWRQVATVNGKVYGIPNADSGYVGIIFRTDMARAAGLNPDLPPKTWDEFIYWAQRLTDTGIELPGVKVNPGQRGITAYPFTFTWLPWMRSSGEKLFIQTRKSPITEREYTFDSDATNFITPDGEDLTKVPPQWRFCADGAVVAAEMCHRIFWQKWIVDPETKQPVNLSFEDASNGYATIKGRRVDFKPKDVLAGMAKASMGTSTEGAWTYFSRGEVAMMPWLVSNLNEFGVGTGIDMSLLSWFPFPAGNGPAAQRVVQIHRDYIVAFEGVAASSRERRDKIWNVMTVLGDEKMRRNHVDELVLGGLARFADPADLEAFGYGEYLRDLPTAMQQDYQDIKDGKIAVLSEPWMGFWQTMSSELERGVFSLIMSPSGDSFDYRSALKRLEEQANSGVMFSVPKTELDRRRPAVGTVFTLVVAAMLVSVFLILRSQLGGRRSAAARGVFNPLLASLLILPALLLITLWQYYPLLRGMLMAFQDYRIVGKPTFVGLDNFIILSMDASFWRSLLRTCYFVFLNMLLTFLLPVVLAVLLTEVGSFKIFFRTLFFLPQMSSGLVIALLWKLMYDPTPQGFFNQLVGWVNWLTGLHIPFQTWLLDPRLAMLCCVVPGVWASMGMSSLIYMAALHSIPEDYYEAAELDGAGIFAKLRHITIPVIMPLILINFVGAFIGTFQSMGNIFLLTFGGPGESTMVTGLKIWIEAYTNLRFSIATSMAWVLGSLLIGFTYMQIRILGRVEYRRAQE